MAVDLVRYAKDNNVKFFLVNFTDLFGVQRSKLVPAQAIGPMQKSGAGFAGFATWLDMTPAHPDMFSVPDAVTAVWPRPQREASIIVAPTSARRSRSPARMRPAAPRSRISCCRLAPSWHG